jgi:SAM-dependent methyltransferase
MSFLSEPRLKNITIGSSEFFKLQNQLISERPLLKHCYDLWYKKLLLNYKSQGNMPGLLIELGSGGSQLKSHIPNLITSDVIAGIADQVIDGQRLPFENESIRALFLTHAFHHIPDVRKFLNEANRCLKNGGLINLIEVANTPFARFFFKNFHPEPFLNKKVEWAFDQEHSMLDSNQALSWIVFKRDLSLFNAEFPNLEIEVIEYLPWLSYLLSGGVTKRNVIPSILVNPILFLEKILSPLRPIFALHWHIKIKKSL